MGYKVKKLNEYYYRGNKIEVFEEYLDDVRYGLNPFITLVVNNKIISNIPFMMGAQRVEFRLIVKKEYLED